ncbi:hypothetical protein [Sphingomonas sp. Leaf242]|uniref:hypothetical protein n=1 Tax=Sphingomonas sp. Leaf242 TaxID=1736304 RepID=UPI000A5C4810|nr:hypothetical protein [Sphingomonas sp. Leaf242]
MKLTQMMHDMVVAFEPQRNPRPALIALAMCLTCLVVIAGLAYLGGTGLAALAKTFW